MAEDIDRTELLVCTHAALFATNDSMPSFVERGAPQSLARITTHLTTFPSACSGLIADSLARVTRRYSLPEAGT